MDMTEITLKLPTAMLDALRRVAAEDDVSPGQLVREAIERDLRRRATAKTPIRADERLVAPLRALLADDFASARTCRPGSVPKATAWPNPVAALC